MKVLSEEHALYQLNKDVPCACTIEQGEQIVVETLDARGGRLKTHDQLMQTAPDYRDPIPKTNPCTGPMYVQGILAGDTVGVRLHGVRPHGTGFILHKREMGICKQMVEQNAVIFASLEETSAILESGLRIPLRPHIGTLGVTPLQPIATAYAGVHGGNMDCRFLEAGSRLFLRTQVDGAMLAVGDVHASMGAGELMGTGIEINASVTLSVEKVDVQIPGPVLRTEDRVRTIAADMDLQIALEQASCNMVHLLQEYGALSRKDALCLLTTICDSEICQSFDRDMFSVASVAIPASYLPAFSL